MEIFVYRERADSVEEGFAIERLPELIKNDKLLIWSYLYTLAAFGRAEELM